jgi:hypothetical protein
MIRGDVHTEQKEMGKAAHDKGEIQMEQVPRSRRDRLRWIIGEGQVEENKG